VDDATREIVRKRAGNRCEYCLLPQEASLLTFHVDHIIAKQHLDDVVDEPGFLCLACNRCNSYKGTNLSSIDPQSNQMVPLYHPRQDRWDDHFQIRGGEIFGLTPIGRATVRLLHFNAPQRVELRVQWLDNGNLW
jgi:5-methylcytosine-specific restriction endonuclease McrA